MMRVALSGRPLGSDIVEMRCSCGFCDFGLAGEKLLELLPLLLELEDICSPFEIAAWPLLADPPTDVGDVPRVGLPATHRPVEARPLPLRRTHTWRLGRRLLDVLLAVPARGQNVPLPDWLIRSL
jgi:hypothetical protein